MNPDKPTKRDENQGEGDRVASRHYNQHVREFVGSGQVDPAARSAEAYVEQKPDDAARAERHAKRGPKSERVSVDELIAKGRTVVERLRPIVHRAVGKLRARLAKR